MAVRDPHPFVKKQKEYRRIVRCNERQAAFGIEWLIRMLLVYTPWWMFPGNWIKAATDDCHIFVRRTLIEIYVILKVVLSWWLLSHHTIDYGILMYILIWLAVETLYALLSGIFLRDIWSEPFSYQRNLLLTLCNFVEMCLCFAAIYTYADRGSNHLTLPSKFIINDSLTYADKHLTPSQAIYFSFITAATIGYGDISPKDDYIQQIVIAQVMISLVFIVMFIANLAGKLGTGALAAPATASPADQAADDNP